MIIIGSRITLKNLERRISHINKNLALNRVKKQIALGRRYGRKYIDVYDSRGRQTGDALTSGTSGEVYEYLGGMQKSLNMISDAKYRRATKRKARQTKKKKK